MCNTIITFHQWYCVHNTPHTSKISSMGYISYRMYLPWWISLDPYSYCMTSLVFDCDHPWASVPLQPRPGFVHPWVNLCYTLHMLVGCYISSFWRNLNFLLLIPFLLSAISYWYPCINWRLVMRMRSGGWTSAEQFMSNSYQKSISGSSIPHYGVLPWLHPALIVISSWCTVWYEYKSI